MMLSDQIKISRYAGENFGPIVNLMNSTYAEHEISDERYLYWEYMRNPDGKAIMNVASVQDVIVSQYAVIPRKFIFRGRTMNGSVSVNTITHPSFRGMNLFPKLAAETFRQCGENNILFTMGFPNPVSLPVIKKKNIFSITGSLSVLFRPMNPVGSLYRFISGRREKSGSDIPLSISISDKRNSVFDIHTESPAYEKLLTAFNKREQLTTYRSVEFFKWRYIDIPRRTYYALKHVDGELNAIIVFRSKYIYGIRCLVIVDIIATGQESVKRLLIEIKNVAKENNIDLIFSAVSPFADEIDTLKSSGYFSIPGFLLPQKLAFIIKKHRDDCPEEVMHFGNWFLTFGDYDIF